MEGRWGRGGGFLKELGAIVEGGAVGGDGFEWTVGGEEEGVDVDTLASDGGSF